MKDKNLFGRLALGASSILMFMSSSLTAQEVIESAEVVSENVQSEVFEIESDDVSVDEIVVTGSRLKRSTFSSISPLQIISAGISREAGLVNAADILQTSTSAGGQQVDLTFSGFVLDNGPGSRTINLRGLGANRTLVMINGRRLAPGGSEGAPYAPNVGMVPAGLVSQYELLTDGASSVYGSDAIGGVTNIILKKDFDGLQVRVGADDPKYDGGENTNLSLSWGKAWDRGFIGMGFDHSKDKHATYGSRPWMSECETNYEVDTAGDTRTTDLYWSEVYGMKKSNCVLGANAGWAIVNGSRLNYTQGTSNGGWNDFSAIYAPYLSRTAVDSDGDGVADVSWDDYSINGSSYKQNAYLYPDYETNNFMSYGEYTFEGDSNLTAYFETMYSKAEYSTVGRPPQLFPFVPANNPYNICNPNAANGVDCGLAEDELLWNNPGYIAQFDAVYGAGANAFYSGILANGPIGAIVTRPVVSVKGDRSSSDAEFENLRFVAGLGGDMPGMDFGTLTNWSFDTYVSYSKSQGDSHRYGIREDRLDLSLGTYSTTDTPCVNDTGADLASDVAEGCVAVNMYAPSLYADVVGDFATTAERDYLFDSRDFDTEYEQTIVSGAMGGDIYEMPNGPVLFSLGFEYRKDEINSMPDNIARDGLFFGYFSDGGAVGSKDSNELFFEIEAPLLANKPFAKELTMNLSMRYTDDEIYGSNNTESVKIGWRPVNSLLVRATYGTAFRAPNLRELYLANQTGFGTIYDPCVTPAEAITGSVVDGSAAYDPAADPRESEVLSNCIANGIDPTDFENGGITQYSVEQAAGGSLILDPETSTSWTAGFSWEQEFSNEFDFGVSSTYYEVDIDSTIVEPNGQYIVNDCYNSITGASPFCSRITRAAGPSPEINFLNNGFINRDNEKARGVDVNVTFSDQITIMDRAFDLSLDITAHRQIERSTLYLDDDGIEDFEDYAGEWGFPDWKANSSVRIGYEKWRLQLYTSYLSSVQQDVEGLDTWSDHLDTNDTGFYADTCLGPTNGDLFCRDVGYADRYMVHSLSLTYVEDNWNATIGARNLFDEAPPKVDGNEVSSVNNAPIGYGYNLSGRTIYANFEYQFGSN